jgi:hemoglobin-like flavoprotein
MPRVKSNSNSRSSGSNSRSSGSNSRSSGSNSRSSQEKVEKKVDTLIKENDDKRINIIAAIKSFVYLNKILTSLTSLDDKDVNKNILIDKILNRMADILIAEKDDAKKTTIIKMISYLPHHSYISKIEGVLHKHIESIVDKDEEDALFEVLSAIYKQRDEAKLIASQIKILINTHTQIKEELQNKPHGTSELLKEINEILSTFINNPYKIDLQTLKNKIELSKSHLKELVKQNRICSRILTPKQVGPICWFLTAFVSMFYSQRSREVIIESAETWDEKNKIKKRLFRLLWFVLNKRYAKTDKEEDNYPKFSDNIFADILRELFKIDGFPYNPDNVSHRGFYPVVYICKLYTLLGIDYKIFDIFHYKSVFDYNSVIAQTVAYSYYNKEYDVVSYDSVLDEQLKDGIQYVKPYTKDTSTPPILMIRFGEITTNSLYNNILKSNTIIDEKMKKQLTSMKDKICYNGKVYILDSVVLRNWNDDIDTNHAIAGITCEGYKYVYNGWVRTAIDNVIPNDFKQRTPCELMPYDWNIRTPTTFCLNNSTCIPDILKKDLTKDMLMELIKTELCFDFSRGVRTLIYVRQDTTCDDKDNVV